MPPILMKLDTVVDSATRVDPAFDTLGFIQTPPPTPSWDRHMVEGAVVIPIVDGDVRRDPRPGMQVFEGDPGDEQE